MVAAGDDFLDESATLNPVTPYGESKVLVERGLRLLADGKLQPDLYAKRDRLWLHPRGLRLDIVLKRPGWRRRAPPVAS